MGRPSARGAGSPQRRWDWNTSAARPGRSPCRQARPPPRAHGWASPQGDVAGGACVTLRRRGVRALDRPRGAAGSAPAPHRAEVPPTFPLRSDALAAPAGPSAWFHVYSNNRAALKRGVASAEGVGRQPSSSALLTPGGWARPEGTRPSPPRCSPAPAPRQEAGAAQAACSWGLGRAGGQPSGTEPRGTAGVRSPGSGPRAQRGPEGEPRVCTRT